MRRVIILFFTLAGAVCDARAQLLNDAEAISLIREGIDYIYNLEFEKGDKVIARVKARFPDHPIGHLMKAFSMYWQYLPIQENKARTGEYVATLQSCIAAVEKQYGRDSKDPEALFFKMASHGYLAMMYNYQNQVVKAVTEAKKAYYGLIGGMKYMENNPDFYFTSGLYNYYVVQYPEDNPISKPLIYFFKSGSRPLGLKQLDLATQRGLVTRAEACFFIARIYLQYQSRPDLALVYTTRLNTWYPANTVYQMLHTETLLSNRQYHAAEKVLAQLKRHTTGFYPVAVRTFQGLLYELDARNDALAQQEYLAAVKLPKDGQFTNEYPAMAYAGLARIAARAGKRDQARAYYKKCLETATYKSLIREAKEFK